MPSPIEYQKTMTEIVFINLPGPEEPESGMAGTQLLHGFLAELGSNNSKDVRAFVDSLCLKWNVHYRMGKPGR